MSTPPRTGSPTRLCAGPAIHTEQDLDAALAEVARLDPEFVARLLQVGGRPALRRRPPGFAGLVAIVMGQQLSTASAAAILARLSARVDPLDAAGVDRVDDASLRACGLSVQKIRTLRNLAAAVSAGSLPFDDLARLPAEQAAAKLVAVRGIGPWTAEIFLLTCLGHTDAWPAGDLALQEAARVMLSLDGRPTTAEMTGLGERWRPWRAVMARLLWSSYSALKGREGLLVGADPRAVTPET